MIATKFCTWHDSSAVVPCAKICSNWTYRSGITSKQIFCQILFTIKKIVCEMNTRSSNDWCYRLADLWMFTACFYKGLHVDFTLIVSAVPFLRPRNLSSCSVCSLYHVSFSYCFMKFLFNSLLSGDTIRCHRSQLSLIQVRACHLFGAKLLPESVLIHGQLDT